jgi:diguanylate cyclase (GGDEF)-like protein
LPSDGDSRAPGPERRSRPPDRSPDPASAEDLAFHDDLTGLRNRRFLSDLFEDRWPGLVTRHPEIAFILIDLDGFKAVNDTYGHPTGDEVLKAVAALLRQHFREEDLVVRYGGDEFLVLLPDAGDAVAGALADRARKAVDRHAFSSATAGERVAVPLSFSMGVASYPADGRSGPEVVEAADRRLYEEKRRRAGRGRGRERTASVALALSLLALAATLFVALGPARPVPAPATPAAAPAPQATPLVTQRERLEGQIGELEARVESLTRALLEQGARRREAEYEAKVRELQDRIQGLQEQVARDAAARERSPVSGSPAPAAPEAFVRATQEQPIVEPVAPPPARPAVGARFPWAAGRAWASRRRPSPPPSRPRSVRARVAAFLRRWRRGSPSASSWAAEPPGLDLEPRS